MSRTQPSRRAIAVCTTAAFCLGIGLPLLTRALGVSPRLNVAETQAPTLPKLSGSITAVLNVLDALRSGWLEKNVPLRGELIRLNTRVEARVFGSMPTSAPVVAGREGWLFLGRDLGRDILEEHRAVFPLTPGQMEGVAREYEARRAWLAERGIRYLVAVAPNKDSIYPELLPPGSRRVGAASLLDQLLAHMAATTAVDVLDLRQAVLAEKERHTVFLSTDSHWNALGAFAAYRAIIARLASHFPALVPLDASAFTLERQPLSGGDLSVMMALEDRYVEDKPYLLPKRPFAARGESLGRFGPGYVAPAQASRHPDASRPRALFFHDSYFWDLLPLLGEHFSRAGYVWLKPASGGAFQFFDKALIESWRPDVVVEEVAERFFVPVNDNSGPAAGGRQ